MMRNPAWETVAAMEPAVMDVHRWGCVVYAMTTSDTYDDEALRVVAGAIMELGGQLQAQFEAALLAARSEGGR